MPRRFRGVRWFALVAFVAVPTALAFAASGAAAPNPQVVGDAHLVSTEFVPRSLRHSDGLVVVQLTGKSVAERQADAGRTLTGAEKNAAKVQARAEQDAMKPRITALGGTVVAQFQSALNGIKVRIAPSKLGQLAALNGVTAVLPVSVDTIDNATSVPLIGAPTVWDAPTSYRGEGIKIGIIDTGIDYTHANFGGSGIAADFFAANATDTGPANPAWFGPAAPRVKGGYDLVGDAYTGNNTPVPDPNPLDFNGHGSHTAGTAAGSGVTAAGAQYAGPYNPAIYTPGAFRIGPGVAPKADIYAYRVFGNTGSTRVTVDAIDRAFDDGMDVINMSLGSSFGTKDDASAVASTNVAKAGMIVVASAGNSGPNQYITGAPGAGTGTISVAANDANTQFPGFNMSLSTGPAFSTMNANASTVANGTAYTVKVITNNPATSANESLGCSAADYTWDGVPVAGKMAVVNRGTCARVAKAIFGEQAGAGAVAMINNANSLPPFEGPITRNPDNGAFYTVTIPFIGVKGSTSTDDDNLIAANGGTATLTNTTIANANYTGLADFTSGGPRNGDSWLKPDVTAPGVSTISTAVASGNFGMANSGTSMAAPHVAGLAALVKQAHPGWKQVQEWKAAIVNTATPAGVGGTTPYKTSRAGSGLVQAIAAVKTDVIALGDTATSTLNFGFSELKADYSQSRQVKLRNKGGSSATFNVAATNAQGSAHSVGLGSTSVTIPAGGEATVNVTLNVPVGTVGNSLGSGLSFREVAGLITFTPATASDNSNVTLRVPYYLVPRALSGVGATMAKSVTVGSPTTNANVSNASGPTTGTADFYAWGESDPNEQGTSAADIRATGAQSFSCASILGAPTCAGLASDRFLVFAVNAWDRWSNSSTIEFDINVDVDPANNNGDDYIVVGYDQGALTTGSFNGRLAVFVFSTRSSGASLVFLATTPTDTSTALLPVLNGQLCRAGEPCLSAGNPRLRYDSFGFDLTSDFEDETNETGAFNAYSSSISQGMYASVPMGAAGAIPVTINAAEWAQTPALGTMIVSLDNKAGKEEATLLPLELK